MPNWCSNTLQVSGDTEILKDFVKKSSNNGAFTLEGLYPTPEELNQQSSPQVYRGDENDEKSKEEYEQKIKLLRLKYGHTCWYEWRIHNWGTKWDASDSTILENSDTLFEVSFETAWAPPSPWVEYVSKLYPELTFIIYYLEPGMDFCGRLQVGKNGYSLDESNCDYADSDGDLVVYDEKLGKWKYPATIGAEEVIIEDEDFSPNAINPFE